MEIKVNNITVTLGTLWLKNESFKTKAFQVKSKSKKPI